MLIKSIGLFLLLVAAFAVFVASRPSDFSVSRSAIIKAQPEAVFSQVNNMHSWISWSPWEKIDPAMKKTFDGPPEGVGASYSWSGNSQVGEGRSTIVESRPYDLIRFKLEMQKPFAATNDVEFTFKPDATMTVVTWTMTGKANFIMKTVGIFLNCDKMVGEQFETGLRQLKAVVEKP